MLSSRYYLKIVTLTTTFFYSHYYNILKKKTFINLDSSLNHHICEVDGIIIGEDDNNGCEKSGVNNHSILVL